MDHAEHVSICWDFLTAGCEFDHLSCWFKHSREKSQQLSTEFKCSLCDVSFLTKREFMVHRKMNHEHLIPQCKYEIKGSCSFGNENCWFKHGKNGNKNNENENLTSNKSVVDRLFKLMEEMSERILRIENFKA